jgi:galactose-1-phosphate uridylyltransferase
MEEEKTNNLKPRRGPIPKYNTEEERKAANRERVRNYYAKNKEKMQQKQINNYAKNKERINAERKKAFEVYKHYKQGKLVENNT